MLGGACTNASIAAAMALEGLGTFPTESAAAMVQARALMAELEALEGLELAVPVEICSNIFTFRVVGHAAGTDGARDRFTSSLRNADVQVSTNTVRSLLPNVRCCESVLLFFSGSILCVVYQASYGQDPAQGDQQQWPVFPLTINPTILRMENTVIVSAFTAALAAAASPPGSL